ncbi:MAG: acyl-CoA reductase [Acidimicrobiia bacterium]
MSDAASTRVAVPHVIKGVVQTGAELEYPGADGDMFATPAINLDELVWPRTEPLPAAEVPVAEIIDLLAAVGDYLRNDPDGLLAEALTALIRTSPYEKRILENSYGDLWRMLSGDRLWTQLNSELGGADVVDSWRRIQLVDGKFGSVKACPTRMVHVLAGNAPGVALMTVARGAMMKGVHLLKMPSNDLLSSTAVLRALAAVAPDHPTTKSFSAIYWRGGDASIESVLFRPQFFDKLVAWGGDSAIRNAAKYLGPGFELISFDPKNSISMIGREVFESPETLAEVADLAAADSVAYNQEACTSSRFHYVEGTHAQIDDYCAVLVDALGKERRSTSAKVCPMSSDIREEVAALRTLDPMYCVFGSDDGTGLVIRSDEPVEFFPSAKTVNVVVVDSLRDAMRYINVATQTVSIYPPQRKTEMRDALAQAGVQRVVPVGGSPAMPPGLAHDGFFPLQRFVRWVNDEE